MKLNKRQSLILDYINKHDGSSRLELEEYVEIVDDKTSKNTIIRDLDVLLKNNYITKVGSARNIKYLPAEQNELLIKYDIDNYFKIDVDNREIKYPQFNFDIFCNLKNLFSADEIKNLENINKIYTNKTKALSDTILKKEYERLLIELSWKSSQIEGNTYSLLDTEILIKENIEAKGHKKEETIMILNHKKALEFIFENKDYFKIITLKKLEELHTLLTSDLGVNKGLRKSPVGIVGTNYKPLFNWLQIKDAVDKLIATINNTENIIEKALITVIMISYIQPFEDGNKRTGRILANALLFANGYCPLSYRSVNESDYKKAVIIFYENNSVDYFKKLFVEQFKFAVEKYF
ncbi:Fic family protein [bacterium]|nr:Fic family protein [bacterium]